MDSAGFLSMLTAPHWTPAATLDGGHKNELVLRFPTSEALQGHPM